MPTSLRIPFAVLGAVLLFATPWLCTRSLSWLWVCGPVVLVWWVWLTYEYMRWGRRVGK